MAAGGQNPMGTSGGTMSTPTGSPGMASTPQVPSSKYGQTASGMMPQGQPLSGNPSGNPNGMPGAPGGTMSSQSRPPGGAPPPPTGTNTSVGPSFGTPRTGMM